MKKPANSKSPSVAEIPRHPPRLATLSEGGLAIHRLHDEACARGERSYIDPQTGYSVFTKLEHLARGYCCNSGCRHCPYKQAEKEPEK